MDRASIPLGADGALLGKIAARMESPHDAEALSAARMTVARLGRIGLRIADVVERGVNLPVPFPAQRTYQPEPVAPIRQHQREAMEVRASGIDLTDWESRFLKSMWEQRSAPSPKQKERLAELLRRARKAREA